jgi:DNA/RNA-binding domain of Phe-tRNA-synthetase-like protein
MNVGVILYVKIEEELNTKFRGLKAEYVIIEGVDVRRENQKLAEFKSEVFERVKGRWTLDQLREDPIFRAYRDFFWRIGVDPTKIRPASEALIRRALRGRTIPNINTLVDAYNLASIDSGIPLAAFDKDKIAGEFFMREAVTKEEFYGIGMDKPVILNGGEVVLEDGEKLVAIYPYRDADISKITLNTRNLLLMICGVPNIDDSTIEEAKVLGVSYVQRFCGGVVSGKG